MAAGRPVCPGVGRADPELVALDDSGAIPQLLIIPGKKSENLDSTSKQSTALSEKHRHWFDTSFYNVDFINRSIYFCN
jgi:hypothetical protein